MKKKLFDDRIQNPQEKKVIICATSGDKQDLIGLII